MRIICWLRFEKDAFVVLQWLICLNNIIVLEFDTFFTF